MWIVRRTDEYDRRHKEYNKKYKRELKATLDNLDIFLESLNTGRKPKPPAHGFLHVEPHDVLAIDQTGWGEKMAPIRLYVYPDLERQILCLLTIGTKSRQSGDITTCKRFVVQIKEMFASGGLDLDVQAD